jgi:hypothetical protein
MTRRLRKPKTRKAALGKTALGKAALGKTARGARKTARRTKAPARDPLDDFIAAGARAMELKIDKAWLPAVRGHLAVTLGMGALVASFPLADDAEPAPVFKA